MAHITPSHTNTTQHTASLNNIKLNHTTLRYVTPYRTYVISICTVVIHNYTQHHFPHKDADSVLLYQTFPLRMILGHLSIFVLSNTAHLVLIMLHKSTQHSLFNIPENKVGIK